MGHILLTAMVNFSGKFACAIDRKAKTNFTLRKETIHFLREQRLRSITLLLLGFIHYDNSKNIS